MRRNVDYIFIPFKFENTKDFKKINESFKATGTWSQVHDEIKYFLKYVADKLDSEQPDKCQVFHYKLSEQMRDRLKIGETGVAFQTEEHSFRGEKTVFSFHLLDVHLYCFTTSVCIMGFKIETEAEDTLELSTALYNMKKVGREAITGYGQTTTFLDMAKGLVGEQMKPFGLEFFYYANKDTERANIFTYVEADKEENVEDSLYYLRRCYSDGFSPYDEEEDLKKREIYRHSEPITWGISPEAAACIVKKDIVDKKYLESKFFPNFNAQYLYMYVLLLHQKYALYMFLMQMGVSHRDDLEKLEEYRRRLYEFESDFVYSYVTEVPQYQNLYERMGAAFELRQMYEDVHEPLLSLSELRREYDDKQERRRENSTNGALLLISALAIFSALVDSFDFIGSFGALFTGNSDVIQWVQIFFVILIFAIGVFAIVRLLINSFKK